MVYTFINSKTGESRDIVMKMSEYQHYKGDNGKEDCWDRVYSLPQVSMGNTNIDPFNQMEYVEKTGKMKGTYGQALDLSAELSEKRAEKVGGEDPVKRKYFNEYSKARKGARHIKDRPKKIDTKRATIEF